MSEVTTLLKVGSTALVLDLLDAGQRVPDYSLEQPVHAVHSVSRDLTGRCPLRLARGERIPALEIQRAYHSLAARYVRRYAPDPWRRHVVRLWGQTLDAIERQDLGALDRRIDWAIKHRLLERYRATHGLSWSSPRLAQLDLAYHDIRRDRGLFSLLDHAGLVDRIASDGEIDHAVYYPPASTRARLRGEFIAAARSAGRGYRVGWDFVTLNGELPRTVRCADPFLAVDRRVDTLIAPLRRTRRRRTPAPVLPWLSTEPPRSA